MGHKWENALFNNLIGNSGSNGDCYILQIDKKTRKEEAGGGKREMAWGPLTAIFVKYCGLVDKKMLESINQEEKSGIFSFDTEPIECFLSQGMFYWGKINHYIQHLKLNQPLDNHYSFLEENKGVLELHLKRYNERSNIKIFEALSDPKKQGLAFKDGIKYFPSDCRHLLKGLIGQSPYKSETPYAIKRILENPSYFL